MSYGEWQLIETAPEDGRTIIVFGGRHSVPTMVAADGGWWRQLKQNGSVPTHWMPLPPPPSEPKEST